MQKVKFVHRIKKNYNISNATGKFFDENNKNYISRWWVKSFAIPFTSKLFIHENGDPPLRTFTYISQTRFNCWMQNFALWFTTFNERGSWCACIMQICTTNHVKSRSIRMISRMAFPMPSSVRIYSQFCNLVARIDILKRRKV